MKVLDVGCGTGFPLLELAQRLDSSSVVHGVDQWGAALARAEFKVKTANIQNVVLTKCDASQMPFPDEEFDLVVSNLGINNFSNPEDTLMECHRVLKQSGKIVLTTNLRGHMAEFYDVFKSTLTALDEEKALSALNSHIDSRTTIESIETLFARTSFKVQRTEQERATMRFVDGSSLLRHYFIKLGFLDAWKAVAQTATAQESEVFSRLEHNLNRAAQESGLLELTIPMAYVEGRKL
jgi:ubiquinone/menaquinone biosynthesis C-methylase UbiE